MKQRLDGPMVTRAANTPPSIINEDQRRVKLSFSSEAPYVRSEFFSEPWVEVLGHGESEVDLSRLNGGAPLLFNHDARGRENHVGVVERAWVEGDKGYAEVRFSQSSEVDPVWQRVTEGTLQNVSVGYQIQERSLTREVDSAPDEYRVTRWTPMEVSVVTVPADGSVGIGRSIDARFNITNIDEGKSMSSSDKTAIDDGGNDTNPQQSLDLRSDVQTPAEPAIDTDAIKAQAQALAKADIEAERQRGIDITAAVRKANLSPEFADSLIAEGASIDEARAKIIDAWSEQGGQPVQSQRRIESGVSAHEKLITGVGQWLLSKSGMVPREADNQYNGMTLREVLRECLEINNQSARGLDPGEMLKRAIGPAMHGMSAFPEIVRNVANKALLDGYNEAPASWSTWCQTGSLADFKTAYRVQFGGFDDLREVKRGGEVKYITTQDSAETIALATYAEKFAIDRQTIIDDDVGAFTRTPARLGEAAAGTVNATAWGILIANAQMSDGVPLFAAGHNNLLTGAAITTNSVDEMRVAMATQRRLGVGSSGRAMNIDLRYLLVPKALEGEANTLRESQFLITDSGTDNTAPNSQRNRFDVVADALLDDNSATEWYGAGSAETVEVAFLDGNQAPTLMEMETTNILGTEWLVYIDCGAAAVNYRTMAKNPGV